MPILVVAVVAVVIAGIFIYRRRHAGDPDEVFPMVPRPQSSVTAFGKLSLAHS